MNLHLLTKETKVNKINKPMFIPFTNIKEGRTMSRMTGETNTPITDDIRAPVNGPEHSIICLYRIPPHSSVSVSCFNSLLMITVEIILVILYGIRYFSNEHSKRGLGLKR